MDRACSPPRQITVASRLICAVSMLEPLEPGAAASSRVRSFAGKPEPQTFLTIHTLQQQNQDAESLRVNLLKP